jgi:hypothetical protein
MASVKAFTERLKALRQAIEAKAPDMLQTMALTSKSLVQERIQREGIGDYSTKLVPSWFMYGRERNQRGAKYLEDINKLPSSERLTNWGNFRRAQGLQADYVDLNYTGRMWGGLILQQITKSGTKYIARLGGSDNEVDEKLYYNTARYGEFLTPNEAEKAEINGIAEDIFKELIKTHLT